MTHEERDQLLTQHAMRIHAEMIAADSSADGRPNMIHAIEDMRVDVDGYWARHPDGGFCPYRLLTPEPKPFERYSIACDHNTLVARSAIRLADIFVKELVQHLAKEAK